MFTSVVEKECNTLLESNNFSELKPILYQYARTIACRNWLQEQAFNGHGIALYMLLRDYWIKTGKGEREIAGDDLIQVLEDIMKFCIRFEQDIACWEQLGFSFDKNLCNNVKSKIYNWFSPVICEDRAMEFEEAFKSSQTWFSQNCELKNKSSDRYESIDDDERQPLIIKNDNAQHGKRENTIYCKSLPSPVWVRAMIWQDPNTIDYVQTDVSWIRACNEAQNKQQFNIVRNNVLNRLLKEYKAAGHARGFIELLRGVQKNWANVATSYGSPVISFAFDYGKAWLGIPSKKN